MALTRSVSTRKASGGQSNGHSPSGRDRRRTWPSEGEMETATHHQSRIEELEAQVRQLEQERDRNLWLFETMPVGYVLIDEKGTVQEFNRQVEKMLGLRRGMLVRGALSALVFQADIPIFLQHLRRCKTSNDLVTTEIRLRNGTSAGLPVELISLAPRHHRKGVKRYRTAIIDLTNRRGTDWKLADTLQNFETLLDTVEGIVWEADGDTLNLTFVSRFAETMLGYPITQWLQNGFWERHIYVDDRERVIQEISQAIKKRENLTIDYRVLTADRRLVWIHDRIGVRSHKGGAKLLGIAV